MSQENMDLARKGLDAFNRRDEAAWLALMDPEMEVIPPRDWPESETIRGSEAVWRFYVENIRAFQEGVLEHVELIDAGNNCVVTHMRGEMHGKLSDASVLFSFWVVDTLRDRKTVLQEWFADQGEALKAAGLVE